MSMKVSIPMELWDGDSDAVITTWLVEDGSLVENKQLVAEIMIEKIQHEIHSPSDGRIAILRHVDEIVGKGDCIAHLR